MNKLDFLSMLRDKLSPLPTDEVEERLNFYSEMIEDRIDEGMTEEEAVTSLGSVDEIVNQILSDIPLSRIVKERIRSKKRLSTTEIVLLAVGFPIWLPLLIAAFAVALSVYACIWAGVVSLWAVFASLAACGVAVPVTGVFFLCTGSAVGGVASIAAGLASAGLAIFAFYGCRAATKGTVWLTKNLALGMKKCFVRKERA